MLLQKRLFLASHAIQAVPASLRIDKCISFIVPETSGLLTPFAVALAKANLLPSLVTSAKADTSKHYGERPPHMMLRNAL